MFKVTMAAVLLLASGWAQTSVNPDISVIGDLLIEPDGLTSSGVELAIQGYVNPFARADVSFHKHAGHGDPVELEEAYLSIERGLPLGFGLRSGKFRPDLGKINKEHMHTFPFILPPMVVQDLLGAELWGATGMEINNLLPLPWYSKVSAGVFAQGIGAHHHEEDSAVVDDAAGAHAHEAESMEPAASARWSQFFDLNGVTHLELGLGTYRNLTGERHSLVVGDFKFRWRPDRYRSFTWQGEYFFRRTDEPGPTHAAYTWASYQFNQIWNTGLMLEYSSDLEEEAFIGAGIFMGFSPVEGSSVFRLRLHYGVHGEEVQITTGGQIIWSLGPHKPHVF